ncbi:hypothetical protein L7F22_068261 [Adiantum nelumboides]|nr:hypothetical protein [Adiantum nelumboides]
MMESAKSTPPPAASANARNSPFAYQTKLLERNGSRSGASSFSLAGREGTTNVPGTPSLNGNGQSIPTDPSTPLRGINGATGLAHSSSIRRYPMPHRHTNSLDPNRAAELRAPGGSTSPTSAMHEFGASNGLATPTSSYMPSNRSPLNTSSASFSTPTGSQRHNRGLSMPPVPRDIGGSTSSTYRPSSPSKMNNSPFARPVSPTKVSHDAPYSPTRSPGSPGKEDSSWISSPKSPNSGSFWSSNSQSTHHTPSAVHLGGVSDLKRSSVGALKIMRDFTTKTDGSGFASDAGHPRMTVGKNKGLDGKKERVGLGVLDENRGKAEDDWKPSRPGRMESEDQEGEIVLPGITTGAEDVAGLSGRIRLARQNGPGTTALGRTSTASALPFSSSSKWMDTQRHLLQAYEYLCHCGEAKEWMEHHVGEDLGAIVDMENGMRDGVFLAKLARSFEPECVPRIFVHPKLQYRHTDNTNYFFRFVKKIGLPDSFHFELTDLYEKKNFPKVVYCIHALSHILARQGRALKVGNLVGKLEFTDAQLQQTQRGLDAAGVAMPSFGALGRNLAKEMNEEPEPEPETEEERVNRELHECIDSVIALQAITRGFLARRAYHRKLIEERRRQREVEEEMARRRAEEEARRIAAEAAQRKKDEDDRIVNRAMPSVQAAIRAMQARQAYQKRIFALADATESIIGLQSACRSVLARRALLNRIRAMRGSTDSIVAVQAQIRGVLARRNFVHLRSALHKAEVTRSIGGLQSLARAALVRKRHAEQQKKLEFVQPDVVGIQAHIRGALARREFEWWRQHLVDSEPVAIHLQSLIRGLLAKRSFQSKMRHYREHMDKVVKIQSLFRGKQQGEQYRSLTMGKNVPVSTIKNFGHLLNDSDFDFEDEIEVERLRKLVVKSIRENQTLENDVSELDTKIALLVKNKIGIEDLVKAKHERGLLRHMDANAQLQRRNSLLSAAGDPFAEHTLDRQARRKLELYQELFYTLQTRPEYLARLFARVGRFEMADKQRKHMEKIVLTLFGYAQKAREEFLLLKLFQRCVNEELSLVQGVQEFVRGNAQFIKLVVQYNRGAKERQYLRDLLGPLVRGIMDDDALDLETDPCSIYRATINQEEMETGQPSQRPLEVNFHEALADPMARTIFIRHLQALRATTELFLNTILTSTNKMPFGIRYIAREMYRSLQEKFPHESQDALLKVVGNLVYYRYLNPAIVAPEGFDVVERLVGPMQRKNLAEISKMLTQIAAGKLFSDDNPYLQPLNEYVQQASNRFNEWLLGVVEVQDAEQHFNADEFLDHTVPQRPVIYISPNEIYSMHWLVSQQLDHMAPLSEDPLRVTLAELGAPPVSATQELNTARDTEITFELLSRRTSLKDPEAETKALFVETKRLVLCLLKVQSGKTLVDVFVEPVTEQNEMTWEEIVSLEVAADRQRQRGQRPPVPADMALQMRSPRLEDVRRMSFAQLKARTLENMLELEKLGKVSRSNKYQDMLNAIAIDIRNKHRKRIQRHNEKVAMHTTLQNLKEKKAYLEEQINSYHSYIDASMSTMQKKGRKKFVLPFTQQYFHVRNLKASGKMPKFGSYRYTAQRLFEKGVLLSLDQFSEKQYDQIHLTISSDEPGLFTIDASVLGVSGGSVDIRIEDLLEAQFSGQSTLSLMDRACTVNLNLLIHLINKKFYA